MTTPPPSSTEVRRRALLAAYDTQLRGDREVGFAQQADRIGPLVRAVYDDGYGFVSYRSLAGFDGPDDGTRLDALIATTVAYFAQETDVEGFEWKTRGHDLPRDLARRLSQHGLVAQEPESVMVGEAALLAGERPIPSGITIRRIGFEVDGTRHDDVRIRQEIAQMLASQRRAFDAVGHHSVESLFAHATEHPDLAELWIAVAEGDEGREVVVTTGRLEVVAGTEFAGIWGGSTLPEWRRRGIYRALLAARARSAMAKGVRYLHSDSTDDSRPILERSGFIQVTTTTPYVWTRPS